MCFAVFKRLDAVNMLTFDIYLHGIRKAYLLMSKQIILGADAFAPRNVLDFNDLFGGGGRCFYKVQVLVGRFFDQVGENHSL